MIPANDNNFLNHLQVFDTFLYQISGNEYFEPFVPCLEWDFNDAALLFGGE